MEQEDLNKSIADLIEQHLKSEAKNKEHNYYGLTCYCEPKVMVMQVSVVKTLHWLPKPLVIHDSGL